MFGRVASEKADKISLGIQLVVQLKFEVGCSPRLSSSSVSYQLFPLTC